MVSKPNHPFISSKKQESNSIQKFHRDQNEFTKSTNVKKTKSKSKQLLRNPQHNQDPQVQAQNSNSRDRDITYQKNAKQQSAQTHTGKHNRISKNEIPYTYIHTYIQNSVYLCL